VPDEPEEQAPAHALQITRRVAVQGLVALGCSAQGCAWQDAEHRVAFDPISLEPTGAPSPLQPPAAPAPPDPPPPLSIPAAPEPSQAVQEAQDWNARLSSGWMLPFGRRVPTAQGGMVTYQRGLGPAPGRLLKVGGGVKQVHAPGTRHTYTCEGWLAPHPTGTELYLVVWPQPALYAYDPRTMTTRWTLDLPSPAQGLFVDAGGRFLLLSSTGAPDPDRLLDHPAQPAYSTQGSDPMRGSGALPPDGPQALGVLLVDLGPPRVVAQATGAYRAWVVAGDGGILLATDSEILRLEAAE